MSLATGHYASVHGVTGNDPSRKYAPNGSEKQKIKRAELITFIEKFDTLPELLAEQGYLSHQSGKWWEGNYKHGGFTHGMTRGFPEKGGRAGDDGLKIGREGLAPCKKFIDMATAEDKPFYMWYAPFMPHTPHTPPARLFNRHKDKHPKTIAKYYAMCEWFDETCGELVGYLDKKGIRENTLIVYVSDNGWIQNPKKRGYAPRSKQTPYEGGIRQPIMFSWPGKLKPAERKELVLSLDIFPTILTATGARQPKKKLPGLDLLSYMKDEKKIRRKAIFGESFAHDIADLHDPEKSLLYRWCIRGKWKLLLTYDGEVFKYKSTHPRTEKRPQLFNLIADPHETKNLAADNPKVVAKMVKLIDEWYPVKRAKAVRVFE